MSSPLVEHALVELVGTLPLVEPVETFPLVEQSLVELIETFSLVEAAETPGRR